MSPLPFEWDVVVLAVPCGCPAVELEAVVRSRAELDDLLATARSRIPGGGDLVMSVVSAHGAPCAPEIGHAVEAAGLRLDRLVELADHALVVAVASAGPLRV